MSGIDEMESQQHERRYRRSWLRQHLMVILALLAIGGWAVAGLIYESACANRILARESEARALDSQQESIRWARIAAPYIVSREQAREYTLGKPLPGIPEFDMPKGER